MADRYIKARMLIKRQNDQDIQVYGFEAGKPEAGIDDDGNIAITRRGIQVVKGDGSAEIVDTVHNRKMLRALVKCKEWSVENTSIFVGLPEDDDSAVSPAARIDGTTVPAAVMEAVEAQASQRIAEEKKSKKERRPEMLEPDTVGG